MKYITSTRVLMGILGVVALLSLLNAYFIVPEGHVGVVKRFGKAISQTETAGLQFKTPWIDTVEIVEVRERKNSETLNAATSNQLPITAVISVNWTVNRTSAMELFVNYGGLEQFEERVLDPKIRNAAKAALSQFPADQLIRDRNLAVAKIMELIQEATEAFPITITSPQIEDIQLPQAYVQAVMAKEQAREAAERERHILAQQELQSRQEVNTANADRDANIARAQGEAEAVRLRAIAEAEAIALVNEQLARSPAYIELVRAKAWNGVLPTTILGDGAIPMMQLR